MTEIENIKQKLLALRLKAMANHLEHVIEQANQKNHDILFVLRQLAEIEAEYRRQNAIRLRFQQSKLHEKITIDQFAAYLTARLQSA